MEKGKDNSRRIILLSVSAAAAIVLIIILIGIFRSDVGSASAKSETADDGSVSSACDTFSESEKISVQAESTVTESGREAEITVGNTETAETVTVAVSEAPAAESTYQTSETAAASSYTESTAAEKETADDDGVIRLVVDLTEDPEKMNGIFASVIEQNAEKLENIVEYGDKFCTNYISVKNDLKVHEAVLDELRVLSNAICDGETDDGEKVRKIAYWVAENVYYNEVAASTSVNEETISLETVLETKTATCAGYSNLFSALCNMQDIYCINMRGGTSAAVTTDMFLLSAPVNHEWNAVKLDGEWVFVDTAWLSNNKYTNNGYEKSNSFDDIYFGMSLELMSYEHRIDLVDYRDFRSSVNAFDENGRWAE